LMSVRAGSPYLLSITIHAVAASGQMEVIEPMEAWWDSLTFLNKGFAIAALAFSVLFMWQVISLLIGFSPDGHGDVMDSSGDAGGAADAHVDHGHDHGDAADHSAGGEVTFSLVSVRSVIAFGTLFSWAGTLYLMTGTHVILSVVYSFLWGTAAMFGVAYVVYQLLRMQEIGTSNVWSSLGEEGVVYLGIPEGGTGKVRVLVSGVISFVNARTSDGKPLVAGTPVRVVGIVDESILEVEKTQSQKGE
jgi:hypothetical protein